MRLALFEHLPCNNKETEPLLLKAVFIDNSGSQSHTDLDTHHFNSHFWGYT